MLILHDTLVHYSILQTGHITNVSILIISSQILDTIKYQMALCVQPTLAH